MTVRTRFAPSPTGRLHLGNVRTAAFNWLFARRHGGAFVVRIEDTDVERNVEGGEAGLLQDLAWLGLDWDEGPDVGGPHGPYRQSERSARHRAWVDRLLKEGWAYPCWCTEGELRARAVEGKDGRAVVRYDGRCRSLSEAERTARSGRPATIRFAVPRDRGDIEVMDEIFGSISFPVREVDDFVIRRSDGRVTYNFAVVADDVDMEITHVLRGAGHLSNTPKQALVFDAVGVPRPVFAHLPTVLGPDGRVLSKRHGGMAVADLREEGLPPDAVLNYLALLGWSDPEGREVLTREELVEAFSLERVGRSEAQVDPDKLRWVAQQHIQRESPAELERHIRPHVEASGLPVDAASLGAVAEALRSRLTSYGSVVEHLPLLFPPPEAARAAARALAQDEAARRVLAAVRDRLRCVQAWDAAALAAAVREAGAEAEVRGRALFHPVRRALTAADEGPDLGRILAALGREEALRRIALSLGEAPV